MSNSPNVQNGAVVRAATELESLVRVVANSAEHWKEQKKILSGAQPATRDYCRGVLISLLSRCEPLGEAQIALVRDYFAAGPGLTESGYRSWIPSEQNGAAEAVSTVPKFFKLLASHDLNHGTRLASEAVNLVHHLVQNVILQGQDASSNASKQASSIISVLTQYLDARKVRWQIGGSSASEEPTTNPKTPECAESLSLLNILAMVVGLVEKTRWRGMYVDENERNSDVIDYGRLLMCFLIASDQRLSEQEGEMVKAFWREGTGGNVTDQQVYNFVASSQDEAVSVLSAPPKFFRVLVAHMTYSIERIMPRARFSFYSFLFSLLSALTAK